MVPAGKTKCKLTASHKRFIYKMLGQDYSAFQVHRMLIDKDIWDEYDLPPINISCSAIYKFTRSRKFDKAQVAKDRIAWRSGFEDIRLYHKQNRLTELQKIVNDSRTTTTDRINALKAIKAEIGEDVGTIAEALKASGTTNIFAVGTLDADQQSTIKQNILAGFGDRQENRF